MNINSKLLNLVYLILFVLLPLQIVNAQQDEVNTQEQEVKDHLIRAETWYWMSRVTFNSLEYHEYAEKEYLTAKEKAASLPQPLKEKYINTAEAGYEQTYWRKINAWNSFRNIFPAAWWYSGDDSTLDYQDEDHLMLALSGCWAGLEAGLSKQLTPKIFVVPRCNDSEKFEQSTDCGEIKDEFLNIMDVNTRFLGIRDDAVATAIGPGWEEFVKGGKPKPEHIKALGDFHQVENIVVVDIYAVDEFEDPIVAGRIDIQFNQWDVNTMRLMSAGNESGVVVSLRDRRWMVPSWLIFLLLISFVFSYIQLKINEDKENDEPNIPFTKYLVPNFIFFLAGYLLSYFSGMVSDQFIPDWGAMALNTDHYLPLAEMWLWSFVHGAVIMVGPIILCAYFLLQFGQRIPGIGEVLDKNDFQNTSTILFSVQAGALGALFSPIIMAWHNEGIILALGLSAGAFLLSVSVARPFSSLVGADSEKYSSLTLFLGILGLILIIPIGFFRPEWAGYWPIIIAIALSIAISLVIYQLNRNISKTKTEKEQKEFLEGSETGSIDYPKWVNRENVKIEEKEGIINSIIDEATKGSVKTLIIGTKNGIGKTRLMEEIYQKLNKQNNDPPWKLVWSTAEKPNEDHIEEPYSLISEAFGDAIGISNLADKQSKQAKFREVLAGVEGTLADLPMGIGALFDFGDEDHEAASKDQIIRDMIEAVRKQIDGYPLAFFLDDIQWADQESLELLEKMIKNLSQKQHNNSLVFVLGARNQEPIQHYFNPSTLSAEIIDLELFNADKTEKLLMGAGLKSFPKWLGEKLVEHIGETHNTPEMIIEVLRSLTIKGSDDSIELPDELNNLELNNDNENLIDEKIKNSIPAELKDSLRIRLNELHDEDTIILEAAAEIGRSFSVTLLAAGLEEERLTLLRSLKRIEDDFHLIIDDQTTDDIMSLESQSLRSVLREKSKYSNYENKRELYKEMHFKISQKMIENKDSFSPLEIMNHCILSGDRLAKESIVYGTQAIESASKKFSWRTVNNIVNKLENLELLKYADPEAKDKIIFYKVKSLRGIGNEDVYTLSSELEKLLQSNNLGSYEVLYTYLENLYNDRFNNFETPTCQYILERINNFKSEPFYQDSLIKSLITFYEILAHDFINQENSIESLEKLIDQIKQIEIGSDQKNNQNALLSIVTQHTANTLAFSNLDNIHEKVITMFDESFTLKKSIGDLQGIAINLGSRARYNLFVVKNYKEATKYFIEDLDYMEKMGDEAARSGILNQTAMSYWGQAQESTNEDDKKKYQKKSYKLAKESFDLSAKLNQTINQARAGNNLLEYLTEMGDTKMINEYGQQLNDLDIWENIPDDIANEVNTMIKQLEKKWDSNWEWVKDLKKKLDLLEKSS